MKKLFYCFTAAAVFAITVALPFKSELCAQSVKSGISVCLDTLIPSLFPFIFFSSLCADFAGGLISTVFCPLLCPLFNISAPAASSVILGVLGGFPTGGEISARLYKEGKIYKDEAERLPVFANNAGAMFVISSVGLGVFHSLRVGLALYAVHITASAICGILTRPREKMYKPSGSLARLDKSAFAKEPFTALFSKAIFSSVRSMAAISADFLIFRVLSALLLEHLNVPYLPLIKGMLEMLGGLFSLSDTPPSIVAAAFILGFNGLCVHMQTAVLFSRHGLSPVKLVFGKLMHGAISASIMYAVIFLSLRRLVIFFSGLVLFIYIVHIIKGRSTFSASTASSKKDIVEQSRNRGRTAPARFFRQGPLV